MGQRMPQNTDVY